jgi:hypothetical protein
MLYWKDFQYLLELLWPSQKESDAEFDANLVKSKSSEYDLDELAIDLDSVYSVTTNCALSLPSKGLGCVNGSLGLLYINSGMMNESM